MIEQLIIDEIIMTKKSIVIIIRKKIEKQSIVHRNVVQKIAIFIAIAFSNKFKLKKH